jgi:sugar (pentulose or hexulose) kinase
MPPIMVRGLKGRYDDRNERAIVFTVKDGGPTIYFKSINNPEPSAGGAPSTILIVKRWAATIGTKVIPISTEAAQRALDAFTTAWAAAMAANPADPADSTVAKNFTYTFPAQGGGYRRRRRATRRKHSRRRATRRRPTA